MLGCSSQLSAGMTARLQRALAESSSALVLTGRLTRRCSYIQYYASSIIITAAAELAGVNFWLISVSARVLKQG